MNVDGKRYDQGSIFVVKKYDGINFIEYRTTFVWYDTEHKKYLFLTPNKAGLDSAYIFPDTRFMKNLIRVDEPTQKEKQVLYDYLDREKKRIKATSGLSADQVHLLLSFVIIALFALAPPIGLIVLLCIVFSDGTPSGAIGCLTSVLIFAVIAVIVGQFL